MTKANTRDTFSLPADIRDTIFKHDHASPPNPSRSTLWQCVERVDKEATRQNVPNTHYIALLTAVFFTTNCAAGLRTLYDYVSKDLDFSRTEDQNNAVHIASLMRDVGLKTISFNGIPKSINCLAALRVHFPDVIKSNLRSKSIRGLRTENIQDIISRGDALFNDIYHPITNKLISVLASNHPDMADYIVQNHYGALLADHSSEGDNREIISLVAVACLRGSGGVAPQVMSHILGLRKASKRANATWLTSEDGSRWVLSTIDSVRQSVNQVKVKSKL